MNFRVESNNLDDALFVQGSDGFIGVGTQAPNTKMMVELGTNGSGLTDALRLKHAGTSANDGCRIQFTSGSSTSGAAIGALGTALNKADLTFYAGGNTERMRIESDGAVLIGTTTTGSAGAGDLVVNGGVFLGGSAAANELDDYEEGTWSPIINGTTFSNGAFYSKVGRMCLIHMNNITGSNVPLNNNSGYTITGLPFSMIGQNWQYGSCPSVNYADASDGYKTQPLVGRQNNQGHIEVANRSGISMTSSDPFGLSMVYSTN